VLHHQVPLVRRERPRLLNDALRERKHADVLEEEPDAKLVEGLLGQEPAPDQHPDRGRVDRVLNDVGPGVRPVHDERVFVLLRTDLFDDLSGHFAELGEELVREEGARHNRGLLESPGQRGARLIARPE
jgi:hypothetical protein